MFKAAKTSAVILLGTVFCLLPCVGFGQAAAYITNKDLQVAVRAFGFVYGMPGKGSLTIDIVYNPASSVSASDAGQIKRIINEQPVIANRTLRAKLIPIEQMGGSSSRIAYITHGLGADYDVILQKASNAKILTFSTDFACVNSQKCVMGVTADQGISIEISRSATAASGLEFSQALKLMIHEVE